MNDKSVIRDFTVKEIIKVIIDNDLSLSSSSENLEEDISRIVDYLGNKNLLTSRVPVLRKTRTKQYYNVMGTDEEFYQILSSIKSRIDESSYDNIISISLEEENHGSIFSFSITVVDEEYSLSDTEEKVDKILSEIIDDDSTIIGKSSYLMTGC